MSPSPESLVTSSSHTLVKSSWTWSFETLLWISMVSAALDCGQISPKVHPKHFQRLWIKNGIQSRKDGTSRPSSSFHIFLPVVGVELLFIFLGNLTNNHVTRNFNFSHKLQSLILYDWKYISSISRAMTQFIGQCIFLVAIRTSGLYLLKLKSGGTRKKPLSFTRFSFCFLRLDSKSY